MSKVVGGLTVTWIIIACTYLWWGNFFSTALNKKIKVEILPDAIGEMVTRASRSR